MPGTIDKTFYEIDLEVFYIIKINLKKKIINGNKR